MSREEEFMNEAIRLSYEGVTHNDGGPFGCVIVKDDVIIARGNNKVTSTNDPTAHAEIVAIREACKNLNSFQLTGCEIYTSCEPCPMCLGAIYWVRPSKIFYANTREDAAQIGFDDSLIYHELTIEIQNRKIPMIHLGREKALASFELWQQKEDKISY
jgi:tRNA(Arg) A34 adenosine deaminase TadA